MIALEYESKWKHINIHMLTYSNAIFKIFFPSTECAQLLRGILSTFSKEMISNAIYSLTDTKVSAKFRFGPIRVTCDYCLCDYHLPNQTGLCLSHCFKRLCMKILRPFRWSYLIHLTPNDPKLNASLKSLVQGCR